MPTQPSQSVVEMGDRVELPPGPESLGIVLRANKHKLLIRWDDGDEQWVRRSQVLREVER